jgi:hypothetical protein
MVTIAVPSNVTKVSKVLYFNSEVKFVIHKNSWKCKLKRNHLLVLSMFLSNYGFLMSMRGTMEINMEFVMYINSIGIRRHFGFIYSFYFTYKRKNKESMYSLLRMPGTSNDSCNLV